MLKVSPINSDTLKTIPMPGPFLKLNIHQQMKH
jgi:hypothetical protein